jgi:hypothetical protein
MKRILFLLILVVSIFLTACGAAKITPVATQAPSEVVVATSTSEPCSKENLPGEVTKVNDLMREFDDYSKLASSTPQAQLVQVIPPMQEVRRRAEAQVVPECLQNLKLLQINHMNTVIETLMAFMGNPKAEKVNQGIVSARDFHLQYDMEIARLLGLTLVPPPTLALTSESQSSPSILNPGPDGVTLRAAPDLKSGGVATLEVGLTTAAFGQTADGKWIQVEVPGQHGQKSWVEAALVQVSGQLLEVTP